MNDQNRNTRTHLYVTFWLSIIASLLLGIFYLQRISPTPLAPNQATLDSMTHTAESLAASTSVATLNDPQKTASSIALISTEMPTETYLPTSTPYWFTFDGFVNCHAEPSITSAIITTIRGQEIKILAKDSVNPNWILVGVPSFPPCWVANKVIKLPQSDWTLIPGIDLLTPHPTFTLPPGTQSTSTLDGNSNESNKTVTPGTSHPTSTFKPTETPKPTDTRSPTDTREPTNTPRPTDTPQPTDTPDHPRACNDGIDNDGDRKIDYPADPGCQNRGDDTE